MHNLTVTDVLRTPEAYEPWARETARWIVEEVCRPAPELGRPGALCPYVPPSIKHHQLGLTACALPPSPREPLIAAVMDTARAFADAVRGMSGDTRLAAHVLVFVGLGPSASVLSSIRAAVKPDLLRQGMNLGEFYADSRDTSMRNSRRRVGSSPWPLLAIRQSMEHDDLFLKQTPGLHAIYRAAGPGIKRS